MEWAGTSAKGDTSTSTTPYLDRGFLEITLPAKNGPEIWAGKTVVQNCRPKQAKSEQFSWCEKVSQRFCVFDIYWVVVSNIFYFHLIWGNDPF